jgi:hypothetical protein
MVIYNPSALGDAGRVRSLVERKRPHHNDCRAGFALNLSCAY